LCGGCGATLGSSRATPQSKFTSPQSYTPKHLAEKILTSKAALEGERKQVPVLFADLKGSMELLADRDPEEARKLLDPVLERMMDAGLEISQDGFLQGIFPHSLYLACAQMALGDLRGGTERLATTTRQRTSLEPYAKVWTKYGSLTGGAWLAAGDVAAAEAEIDRGLAFTEPRDAFTGAATSLERGLTLAMELGLRPEIAHCHLGLSRLYRRTGKREQAQEHLTTASTMYREMDMPFWLEQAEAEPKGSS
jgi:hypothetical protein